MAVVVMSEGGGDGRCSAQTGSPCSLLENGPTPATPSVLKSVKVTVVMKVMVELAKVTVVMMVVVKRSKVAVVVMMVVKSAKVAVVMKVMVELARVAVVVMVVVEGCGRQRGSPPLPLRGGEVR